MDSNILLDVFTKDPVWFEWSAGTLAAYRSSEQLVINQLIFAEVSLHFESLSEAEVALPSDIFLRVNIPWEAAYLAGRCYLQYKQRGGVKTSPLPDFYIGGHATVSQLTVMTRDSKRFRTYFPDLALISPD